MNDIDLLIGFLGLVTASFLFCYFIYKERYYRRRLKALKDKIRKKFDVE
jgi:hypothetical protein